MARKKKTSADLPIKGTEKLVGVDSEMNLYDLVDLFYSFYQYHNNDCQVEYSDVSFVDGKVKDVAKTLSRFDVLRRIIGLGFGSRPFAGGKGNAAHRPNANLGYFKWLMTYLSLPYKSVFTDSAYTKIKVDKKLFDVMKLSKSELEAARLEAKNNPNLVSNAEIGDDVTDCFNEILGLAKGICQSHDYAPTHIAQEGFAAFLHENPDLGFDTKPIESLDLVTEPQAEFDASTWSAFFILKKMSAQEIVSKIKKPGAYWNEEALRWALESSQANRGIIGSSHYRSTFSPTDSPAPVCNENFTVRSFYKDKQQRTANLNGYYGNMLVVEGYYIDAKGTVTKVIFFPSDDFKGISKQLKKKRQDEMGLPKAKRSVEDVDKADVLFRRTFSSLKSLDKLITVIPCDRSELSLERQRGHGHEQFNVCEVIMRIDCAMLNIINLMSVMFTRNGTEGETGSDAQDITINFDGETVELGDRQIVTETPFIADLKSIMVARTTLIQHAMSKAFLGGLDGGETTSNGRGAALANLRLVRDGRVHKHNVEDFCKGLNPYYRNIFSYLLKLKDKPLDDGLAKLARYKFFDRLTKQYGHSEKLFEFKSDEVLDETGLPYWMDIAPVRNGASHFGAAELVLYSEIKQVFGDGLSQEAMDALNRMGIKSLLGAQDAIDILGDPRDKFVTSQDQVWQAQLENATILGSVNAGLINFEPVGIRPDKDDHVAHLMQVHNVKAQEIIKRLEEGDVASEDVPDEEMPQEQLETRVDLILMLSALANHISLHAAQLATFGKRRTDINRLKEETNMILQSAEGLLNNLQNSLRALQAKKADVEMKMKGMSPENEADKMKQQTEMQKLAVKQDESKSKLLLANKIADQRQQQHVDKQLTKARDRAQKERQAEREVSLRLAEIASAKSMDGKEQSSAED